MKPALRLTLAALALSCTPRSATPDATARAVASRPDASPSDAPPPDAPPVARDAAAPPADVAAEVAAAPGWATMSRGERMAYMEDAVLPEMQRMFRAFDARKFARVTCATCHGANGRAVQYRMPNGLDPLTPSRIPARYTSQRPMDVFMVRSVLPRMAQLLGKPVATPPALAGFSCFGCHGTRPEPGR
jgi:cytochrome c553